MKKIIINNYGNEAISDKLLCENINEYYAKKVCDILNNTEDECYYFKVVEDDYKLYVWEP